MRRKTANTEKTLTDDENQFALRLTVAVGMSRLLRQMSGDGYLLPEYRAAIDSLLREWDEILFNEKPKITLIQGKRRGRRRANLSGKTKAVA